MSQHGVQSHAADRTSLQGSLPPHTPLSSPPAPFRFDAGKGLGLLFHQGVSWSMAEFEV